MQVSIEEFVKLPAKYIDLASEQDIFVSRGGQEIARITGVTTQKEQALAGLKRLRGILPDDIDLDQARMERILK